MESNLPLIHKLARGFNQYFEKGNPIGNLLHSIELHFPRNSEITNQSKSYYIFLKNTYRFVAFALNGGLPIYGYCIFIEIQNQK
jgi:hypothetical protein